MRTKTRKWGNSLGVRIPKTVAEQVGLHEHDELEIVVEDGAIKLRPCEPQLLLAELLEGITADNLHGEIDFGQSEGNEIW